MAQSDDSDWKEKYEAWELYLKWKNTVPDSSALPRFYYKEPHKGSLQQMLREEAKVVFLERKNRDLLDNDDLQNLWVLLEKHRTPAASSDEHMMNYADFKTIANQVDKRCRPFFSARIFAKLLQSDPDGRISVRHFYNYVIRKVWLLQIRIGLSIYDMAGQGYLREANLENYILDLILTLPQLDGLESSFYSIYVCTAVRKFFFFLDPLKTNKVKIKDILTSSLIDDLLELRDENLPKNLQDSNWFSAPSALRVYGQYLNLDTDHNGLLSKEELVRYGTGTLTPVFIERVFQECTTFNKEMDYPRYLDFVLALENRKEPQSLQYFFKILDLHQKNYLSPFDFNYFFRAIQEQMRTHGQEPVSFEDVKDEIYDMIRPADPWKVTFKDLVLCGKGETVVTILIDLNGFWNYENREMLTADVNEEVEV